MKKSISAKVMTEMFHLWPKSTAEERFKKYKEAIEKGAKQTPAPDNIVTRYEDHENGGIFYANEKGVSRYTVFYIHGGAYEMDFIQVHWVALAEYFKKEGIRLPDELILYSPWVDISMENEEIKEYIPREPLLEAGTIWPAAKGWAADLDLHDPLVSPIYGDLKGLRNVTVFLGTEEILYPDVTKMFHMLDADVSNELIVGEEMFHCYPLAPIEEAKPACRKIFHIVMR